VLRRPFNRALGSRVSPATCTFIAFFPGEVFLLWLLDLLAFQSFSLWPDFGGTVIASPSRRLMKGLMGRNGGQDLDERLSRGWQTQWVHCDCPLLSHFRLCPQAIFCRGLRAVGTSWVPRISQVEGVQRRLWICHHLRDSIADVIGGGGGGGEKEPWARLKTFCWDAKAVAGTPKPMIAHGGSGDG